MSMYLSYFGLDAAPFSIVPDHKGLYMSESHREAVAHLLYAVRQSGGFVQLTGEVGTGKTTVSRYILSNLPADVDVALLLNPRINEQEMLKSICDELGISHAENAAQKQLIDKLNAYLLDAHARGRHTVLMVDEAQNLSREVLEQIRLLTNLETSTDKLLQIILIGQPELIKTLQRHDLRQLSQRIIGRFRLAPLSRAETREYIEHRLHINGATRPLFSSRAIAKVHKLSGGIPRLINVLCDRALMGAYANGTEIVSRGMIKTAAKEVLINPPETNIWKNAIKFALAGMLLLVGTFGVLKLGQSGIWHQTMNWVAATTRHLTKPDDQNHEVPLPVSQTSSNDVASTEKQSAATAETSTNTNILPEPKPVSAPENVTANKTPTTSAEPENKSGFDLTYRLGVPLKHTDKGE